MKARILLSCFLFITQFLVVVDACTGFCVSSPNQVLVGNNEDWFENDAKIWFEPAAEARFGRIYLGMSDFHARGGINDQGLCFDGFAVQQRKKVIESRGKPRMTAQVFIDFVMSTCSTVQQVLSEMEKIDPQFLEEGMIFFADAKGDSVIIEGDEIVRKKGHIQVVTNFYQTDFKIKDITCSRFHRANEILAASSEFTIESCKEALFETHQKGEVSTVYSNIYDLKNMKVYIYSIHDFQQSVTLNVSDALKKGKRQMDLRDIFQQS